MAVCIVCSAPARVYCRNDECQLCAECDLKIHSSNPVAARHVRIPVEQDSHSEVADSHVPLGSSAHSELVVPQLQPSPVLPEAVKDPWAKEFEILELDSAWLQQLDPGFDFADILIGGDETEGLVPTLSGSFAKAAEQLDGVDKQQELVGAASGRITPDLFADEPSEQEEDDLVVPSWPPKQSAPPSPLKRPAASADPLDAPPAKIPAVAPAVQPAASLAAVMTPSVAPTGAQSALLPGTAQPGVYLTREQRVARYLEKRKHRKFQKTIRYASRKAYAEVRPRVKGRFVKREETA